MPNYLVSASDNAVILRTVISRKSEGLLFRYAPEDKDRGEQSHYSSLGVSGLLGGQSGPLIPVGNRRMARREEHSHDAESNGNGNGNGHHNGHAKVNGNGHAKLNGNGHRCPLSPLRKRRTRQHVIADLSYNFVERLILRCGWVARRAYPDYGVDMQMETYIDDGEVENGWGLFQLKATDHIVVKHGTIPVRLDWRDLLYWLNEPLPGLLVYYDAQADRAWWLHLQQALRAVKLKINDLPRATVTFHIPLENALDEAAIRSFAKLRDAAVATMGDRLW